jgi:tRNA1(Val) A37 N6-methylase TrmN6
MFCYFIQKRRFLNNDADYLRNKLKACRETHGKDRFYSFYRHFLKILFHKGFAMPEHNEALVNEIGNIPYLNGGLFDVHELETHYSDIDIKDEAFEKLFIFFDHYQWTLDIRPGTQGDEINPDVLGYIFEKYINDRAQMGAYYTKEDITEYIAKNCIIPSLFDTIEKTCQSNDDMWRLMINNSDTYIYDAIKHGVDKKLPSEIEKGVKSVPERGEWNKPAPSDYALPTEIWREVVARRQRYDEVKEKIAAGGITHINDFITYNLNIRQFAQDSIEQSDDATFIKAFWEALKNITILDPTCGSGAFLFAALNILEPLYESCIMRMRGFIEDEDRQNAQHKEQFSNKYKMFRETLEDIQNSQHPNQKYFIYKTIILNNLYGVDIMKEAVEIAKLRLFLKLVAVVKADYRKPNLGLEPLPDIDFNIRSGNTLIGFANEYSLAKAVQDFEGDLVYEEKLEEIKQNCAMVSKAYNIFCKSQIATPEGEDAITATRNAKENMRERLSILNEKLDKYLAKTYGIDSKGQWKSGEEKEKMFKTWKETYRPFHWFAEFYQIIVINGGFDVVIGNPPYVEYAKVKNIYTIKDYETEKCGNLYAFVMERAGTLLQKKGKLSMIIPLASFSTKRMLNLQNFFYKNGKRLYLSNFEATSNPTTLFIGVKIQLSIIIWEKNKYDDIEIYTTAYKRCYSAERNILFDNIYYSDAIIFDNYITRKNNIFENNILKVISMKARLENLTTGKYTIYYRNMGNFFYKLAFDKEPIYYKNNEKVSSSTVSVLNVNSKDIENILIGLINSSLFYYYWILFSDCYHLSKSDIINFHFEMPQDKEVIDNITNLTKNYMVAIEKEAVWQNEIKKDGTTKKYRRYFPQKCKYIADEIDHVLAKHYGFTDEELDFIINYDIKYRMGGKLEER